MHWFTPKWCELAPKLFVSMKLTGENRKPKKNRLRPKMKQTAAYDETDSRPSGNSEWGHFETDGGPR